MQQPALSNGTLSEETRRARTEALRRRIYLTVAWLACLSQLLIAGSDLRRFLLLHQGGGPPWEAGFGALMCGLAAVLLQRRVLSLQQIEYTLLAGASVLVALQLAQVAAQPMPPTPRLYFIAVFLFLAAYSILPVRLAAVYSGVLYAVLAALTLFRAHRGDSTLLVELAVIVMLIAHLSSFGRQVSAQRSEAQDFQRLALTDALTGLENRRAMYLRLDQAFLAAASGRPSAALLLDIDHFKAVNDRHGHELGDQVLQAVGALLDSECAASDRGSTAARWGGEEFLILLPGADEQEAQWFAERLLESVRAARLPGELRLTMSIGVAFGGQAASVSAWLAQADAQLYHAKREGRDRVRVAQVPAPFDHVSEQMTAQR